MRFAGNLLDILLQRFAQAQLKTQLGYDKQRADKKPDNIIDKGRLFTFKVMANKLQYPTDHK